MGCFLSASTTTFNANEVNVSRAPCLLVGRGVFLPQRHQGRNVSLVELGNARSGAPAFRHPAGNDLAEGRERRSGDRAPFGEVNLLRRRLGGRSPGRRGGPGCGREPLQLLDVGAHILHHDPPTAGAAPHPSEVNAQVARQLPNRWGSGGRCPCFWLGDWFRNLLLQGNRNLFRRRRLDQPLATSHRSRRRFGSRRGGCDAAFAERQNPLADS